MTPPLSKLRSAPRRKASYNLRRIGILRKTVKVGPEQPISTSPVLEENPLDQKEALTSLSTNSKCLICRCKLEPKDDNDGDINILPDAEDEVDLAKKKSSKVLQCYQHAIFILRNVLEISGDKLTVFENFKEDNTTDSFQLCEECTGEVKHAEEVYTLLQEISKEYEETKMKVAEKMKEITKSSEDGAKEPDEISAHFWKLASEVLGSISDATEKSEIVIPDDDVETCEEPEAKDESEVEEENVDMFQPDIEMDTDPLSENPLKYSIDSDGDEEHDSSTLEVPLDTTGQSNADNSKPNKSSARSSDLDDEVIETLTPTKKNVDSKRIPDPEKFKPIKIIRRYPPRTLIRVCLPPGQPLQKLKLRKYSCGLCLHEEAMTFPNFMDHIHKQHLVFFRCVKCTLGFKDTSDVSQHWSTCHKRHLKEFPFLDSQIERVDAVLPLFPSHCPKCSEEFKDESLRDKHLVDCQNVGTARKTIACNLCTNFFYTVDELELHKLVQHPLRNPRSRAPLPSAKNNNSKTFKCDQCSSCLKSEDRLRIHRAVVHHLDPFECDQCDEVFYSKRDLWSHLSSAHGVELKKFSCYFAGCNMEYYDQSALTRHISSIHSGKVYKCRFCEKTFTSRRNLPRHERRHQLPEDAEAVECKNCGKKLKNKDTLSYHMYRCQGKKIPTSFECSECGDEFRSGADLQAHKRFKHNLITEDVLESEEDTAPAKKTKSLNFKCSKCSKTFTSSIVLKHHAVGHNRKRKHCCFICHRAFQFKAQLEYHNASVHSIGVDNLKCNKCQVLFKSRGKLASHKCGNKNFGLKKNVCQECGKEFQYKSQVNKHLVYQHGKAECRFTCDICGKKDYLQASHLYHLARVHSIGDWKCQVEGCSEVYSTKKDLEEHDEYKHMGKERPRTCLCPHCGKGFAQGSTLKTHIAGVHSSERPFQCVECGKRFATSGYLSMHKKCHKK